MLRLSRVAVLWPLLQPTIAAAVELGDIQVRSQPGGPFAATVPLIVQPGEQYQYGVYSVRTYQERTGDGAVLRNVTNNVTIQLFQASPPYLSINGPIPAPGAYVGLTLDARLGTVRASKDFVVAPSGVATTSTTPAPRAAEIAVEPPRSRYVENDSRVPPARGGGYWDVRFSAGVEPPIDSADYDAGNVELSGDWTAPGGMAELAIAHRFASSRPHSGYIRFGAYAAGFQGDNDQDSSVELRLASGGVHFGGGYSYRRNDTYSLEVGPSLSLGYAQAEETVPGQEGDYTANGAQLRFGAGATNLFNFGGFQLGLAAGVATNLIFVTYDEQDLRVNGQTFHLAEVDATYKGTLIYASVSLGFRN